jgi:hypothetical protein
LITIRSTGSRGDTQNPAWPWGRVPRSPLETLAELFQRPAEGWGAALLAGRLPLDNWLDLTMVIFFLICGVVLLAQRRWSEAAFVLLGAWLPLSWPADEPAALRLGALPCLQPAGPLG